MPNLDILVDLLKSLQGAAEQRPDLLAANQGGPSFGSPDYRAPGDYKVATFAGRVVRPSENARDVLTRVPTAELEGGGQALGALPAKLIAGAASKAMMVPGGRFYHGTPNVFDEFNPSLSKSSGLVGPGHAYLTDAPVVAADYARGATAGAKLKSEKELADYLKFENTPYGEGVPPGFAPNIRPYLAKTHNAFVTDAPLGQADFDAVLNALKQHTIEQGQLPGRLNPVQRANNQVANLKANAKPGDLGQKVWEALSNASGPETTNKVLKQAGFQSIQYPGGVIMGDTKHRALNVLDPKIMQNLFDALTGKE